MLLDNFDAAHARLWQVSTGVNTELMLTQVLLHLNPQHARFQDANVTPACFFPFYWRASLRHTQQLSTRERRARRLLLYYSRA